MSGHVDVQVKSCIEWLQGAFQMTLTVATDADRQLQGSALRLVVTRLLSSCENSHELRQLSSTTTSLSCSTTCGLLCVIPRCVETILLARR